MNKPSVKPNNPNFSSGPCAKRPGWSVDVLQNVVAGRSHRSAVGKARIKQVIELSKEILQLPSDYLLGIVPASDTGAVEMAIWSLIGERAVDVFAWESFGGDWVQDVKIELAKNGFTDFNIHQQSYGKLPDFSIIDGDRDVIFTYNGTTSGVRVPNLDFIPQDRTGLSICDATSAVFAMDIDWQKLDVATYSWQKAMGGEAAHGVIILSPRAVKRLENYSPKWGLPKLFRMAKYASGGNKLIKGIFEGATINTPSMLAMEDAIDSLNWMKSIGGLAATMERSDKNLQAVSNWVGENDWIDFLSERQDTVSNTSICLKITADWYQELPIESQNDKAKELVKLLEKEQVAFDIASYRDAPPGIRIWGGATVEVSDIQLLLPWLNWAYEQIKP